jgi:uncharacterized protein (TIGR04255 family)
MKSADNPFELQKYKEIDLPKAPLKRVIAQVRFPTILLVEDRQYIASFHDSLRNDYPILSSQKGISVNIFKPEDKREETLWNFVDESKKWRIVLAPEFIAIETLEYSSRTDFLERFEKILACLEENIDIDMCTRIGVRYINQITGDSFDNVSNLFRSEILGIYESGLKEQISSSLRQTVFSISKKVNLNARWGVLAKNQTYDPNSLEPINKKSWIFDLDAFSEKGQSFDSGEILKQTKKLSEYAYNFFRWSIKKEFITKYGGQINA